MKISRDEALKAVDDLFNYCEEIDNSLPENEKSGYEMLPDIHKIRKYIIENEKPLVEWIPCSERLPEEDGKMYLVTSYCEQINRRRIHFSYCYANRDGYWSDVLIGYKVIAWMPLPEPYMKEGEKE